MNAQAKQQDPEGSFENILDRIGGGKRKPAASKPEQTPAIAAPVGVEKHFRSLGYNQDRFYFFTARGQQIRELNASKLARKTELLTLAPLDWWESEMADRGPLTGRSLEMAANYLIQACYDKGVFSVDKRRGRGVWVDGDDIVIHAGDRLYVNGEPVSLIGANTDAIYERQAAISISMEDPMGAQEASLLLDLGRALNFETVAHGTLWAGWLVVSIASGALSWRPHILLNGPKGCGKSSVMAIAARVLGNFCLSSTGGTTASGLRQTLASDALPVVFDEAEGDSQRAAANIDDVLALMRHSSAGFDAKVIKGGADGRATATTVRSCFCLSAIRDPLVQAADQSRVTVLPMRPATAASKDAWRAQVQPLSNRVTNEAFATRLRGRIFSKLPILLESVRVFSEAASLRFGESRMGDQIGTLMGGAWMLCADAAPTLERASQALTNLTWGDQEDLLSEASDEMACLRAILEAHIRVDGSTWHGEASVGELVQAIRKDGMGPAAVINREMERALAMYGIKVIPPDKDGHGNPTGDRLLVSNTNGMLARKIMGFTLWPKGWGKLLARLPGSEKPLNVVTIGGHASRCVSVPLYHTDEAKPTPPKSNNRATKI